MIHFFYNNRVVIFSTYKWIIKLIKTNQLYYLFKKKKKIFFSTLNQLLRSSRIKECIKRIPICLQHDLFGSSIKRRNTDIIGTYFRLKTLNKLYKIMQS